MRIALIEPDPRHAQLVTRLMFAGGHVCQHFATSAPFLAQAADQFFDLLITENWTGDHSAEDVIARARAVPAEPAGHRDDDGAARKPDRRRAARGRRRLSRQAGTRPRNARARRRAAAAREACAGRPIDGTT